MNGVSSRAAKSCSTHDVPLVSNVGHLMSNKEVSERSFDSKTMHLYQNLNKSSHHGIALLLFDDLIFLLKRDGFWHRR